MISNFEVDLQKDAYLLDVDVSPNNDWIAIVSGDSRGNVIRSDQTSPSPIHLSLSEWIGFGCIRFISSTKFLVVNRRTVVGQPNAAIFDVSNSSPLIEFYAGDAIEDVLVTDQYLVFTYFDEGVFGDCELAQQGLSVFSHDGQFCYGYLSHFGDRAFDVACCYAACTTGGDEIAFCAYTGFQLVNWNIAARIQAGVETPKTLHFAAALTCSGDEYYFHAKHKSRKTIFKFKDGIVEKLAGFQCNFKTLPNGRLVDVMHTGFDVLDCTKLAGK